MKKIFEWIKSPKSDIVLFIIGIVLLNIVGYKAFKRVDLTSSNVYSLSKASKEVVKNLEDPLIVNVFFDEDLPATYSQVYKYLKDLLEEYKSAGNKNFIVNYMDMTKQENVDSAVKFGIRKVQDSVYNNNGVSVKLDFRGIAISYGNDVQIIDPIDSTGGLEYMLTSTFTKMISSVDMLSSLKAGQKIKVSIYMSESLYKIDEKSCDAEFQAFRDLFDQVNAKMEDRLEYESKVVPDAEAAALADKYGFYVKTTRTNEQHFIGAVVSLGENFRTLPVYHMESGVSIVLPDFSDDQNLLVQGIQSLMNTTSKIGYITGHNETPSKDVSSMQGGQSPYSMFAAIAGDSYTVTDIDLSKEDIPLDMNSLIICEPHLDYSDEELYKIDQFVMRGGNLIVFKNSLNQNPYAQYGQGPAFYSVDHNIDKLLGAYGIERNSDIVLDTECMIDYQNNAHYYWQFEIPKERVSKSNPITKNFGNFTMFLTGSLSAEKAKEMGLKTTVLARTSDSSWAETPETFAPSTQGMQPSGEAKHGPFDVLVLVEGNFKSAYTKTPDSLLKTNSEGEYEASNFLSVSKQPGKVLVCSNANIVLSNYINPNNPGPSALLIANILDYMNGNEDLCEMRTKGRSTEVLNVKSKALAKFMQYFNEFGIPLFVIIAGIIVYVLRKNRKRLINERYNPDDNRTIQK